mmetsp:Transcript_24504/g.76844  ORF Transcript_24504/g.76844 Transcript_24504/m.76844 type:complete len:151 (-) Transcript_24504:41-493(-)|eukprot:CAMPEP_0118874374 /NCGR_PEP_ID=MMETSP1163-20130328/15845_1 /TAXON_ID=124430 /ORGANISM="Phaeomonas parva, Strain CCMP2877" /LENGTH=150 /DNA_ID=CAMNT_0006809761 /DNA_START=68 /DNA_END=520 /DNA_ORIENTATION=+
MLRLLCAALLLPLAAAWGASRPLRVAQHQASKLALAGSLLMGGALALPPATPAAVINVERCEGGAGSGCAAAVEEANPYIKELLKKSETNHDKYMKDALDDYNWRNWKDYFPAVGKVMLKKESGGFAVITDAEYAQAKAAGKISGDYLKE